MPSKYTQAVTSGKTRFTAAPMAELEFSTVIDSPTHLTTCNAGDIVPIYCAEVLPHDTFEIDLDFVTRQATVAVPVMGQLVQDFYAFFVPNRVVNKSWKNVMGENTSGSWVAPTVSLAPLCPFDLYDAKVQIPVGSVADYYGFPTQAPINKRVLNQCHDLKFRGYLECYNHYFRDQNYQPPIPYSKLNVYNGFLVAPGTDIALNKGNVITGATSVGVGRSADGAFPDGGIVMEFVGEGGILSNQITGLIRKTSWSALSSPLKANKMHDYFTSVLPTPQKGRAVAVPLTGVAPLDLSSTLTEFNGPFGVRPKFSFDTPTDFTGFHPLGLNAVDTQDTGNFVASQLLGTENESGELTITGSNLVANLNESNVSISVNDLRLSSAIQRIYEILGNGGSRYTEFVNSFFGLEVDNPFDDIPTFLGHYRRDLDLFQTAQTSASPSSEEGAGNPLATLGAFGYTNSGGKLFVKTFNEHGYIHIFTVIRHKNVYSSLLSRDNFRMSMLDFYSYPLANISEQPVYTREINPFAETFSDSDDDYIPKVFGYQEAWAEYRMEPDRVSGYMRPGVNLSVSQWNYADDFNASLVIANGEFLKSNTSDVVRRSTSVQDRELPQFKLQVSFHIKKERPMPIYSIPGADIF